jgi:1-deoxy-D-xylulose-5-phosphate synthase
VVDPRWVLPVPEQVVKIAGSVRLVVTLEESGVHGGVGSAVAARMREARIDTPVRSVGVPQRFLAQAARGAIHADLGLTAADLVTNISFWVKRAADFEADRGE